MAIAYVLREDGSLSHILKGDINTVMLNIEPDHIYTMVEPEDAKNQKFNITKKTWEYLPNVEG